MDKLLILGAGQHGQVVKEYALLMNCFECIDFLDDNAEAAIGKLADYKKFAGEYKYAFAAFGDGALRMQWITKLEEAGYQLPVIVSDRAYISPSAKLNAGTIAEAGAVVNTNVIISKGCILSIGAMIDHDTFVGEGCHIESGVVVMPNSIVMAGTTIKENSVYDRKC